MVALAKASSLGGAAFGGLAAGFLVYTAGFLNLTVPRHDAIAAAVTLAAAAILVAAGAVPGALLPGAIRRPEMTTDVARGYPDRRCPVPGEDWNIDDTPRGPERRIPPGSGSGVVGAGPGRQQRSRPRWAGRAMRSSRCPPCPTASVRRARRDLPGVAIRPPPEVVAAADLVLLTVPDDVLPGLVTGLAATGAALEGRLLAHTSGRHGLAVLEPGGPGRRAAAGPAPGDDLHRAPGRHRPAGRDQLRGHRARPAPAGRRGAGGRDGRRAGVHRRGAAGPLPRGAGQRGQPPGHPGRAGRRPAAGGRRGRAGADARPAAGRRARQRAATRRRRPDRPGRARRRRHRGQPHRARCGPPRRRRCPPTWPWPG